MIDTKKFIPEQIKKKWFWIYIIVVAISIFVLKTELTPPFKIISLFLLIIFQFIYNKKVNYEAGINTINWILFVNLILISLAYLFASFKDYNLASIMLLLMIVVVLIATTSSYIIYLWKIKDSKIKKPIIKVIIIIILYLALAINTIILFSFFFTVVGSFQGNEILYSNNTKVIGLDNIIFYSGTIFYTSVFGNMIPNGLSQWITLFEYSVSYIIHIILLGIIVSSFITNSDRNK
ncbi:hypothetical protein HYX04_01355 [Candidatus Woesearchaeota archaeon]|nr:hypothetical protein [Candidatus Woesearchaeota archaeon]